MTVKLVVLYPQPLHAQTFERIYHSEHMPLMHRLIAPVERVPTFKVNGPPGAPFYRMAEIHFPSLIELTAFATSEAADVARRSSEGVSTGGKPLLLLCEADARASHGD